MRESNFRHVLQKTGWPAAAVFLFLLASFLLVAPDEWAASALLRVSAGLIALIGAGALASVALRSPGAPSANILRPPPSTALSPPGPSPARALSVSHITSHDLLKAAAEQKKTIEELRATVQVLEKQLAGMRLQAGLQVDGQTVSLWAEESFRRVLEGEMWRSRRTQRPMTLLLIDFSDERPRQGGTAQRPGGAVDSSVWEYYAETVCRSVRGGDHVGLVPGGALCVLLTETTPDAAKVAQERVMKLVEKERQRRPDPTRAAVAIDTAIVGFPRDGKDLEGLLLAAQKTILRAQRDRRVL
ncbi:MAG: hypothetical protein MUE60_06920 [Candidatus Eisenbacteria bacterium]|nr:hypothetical protein [Candidatus Eisenbacteria bacterium]